MKKQISYIERDGYIFPHLEFYDQEKVIISR